MTELLTVIFEVWLAVLIPFVILAFLLNSISIIDLIKEQIVEYRRNKNEHNRNRNKKY